MPRVSRVPISKDVYRDINDSFVSVVSDLVNPSEVEKFLNDFLTAEERLMLSKRLVLALLIQQGYSQTEIKNILRVSRTTINQMKHLLTYKQGLGIGVKRLVKSEGKLEGILKHVPPLTRSGKSRAKWLNR